MKKLYLIIVCIFTFTMPAPAEVQHITVDQAVTIANGHNLQLTAKRRELSELRQKLRAANALKNPAFESNFLMGKVTRGNSSQFGAVLPIEIAKRSARKNVVKAEIDLAQNEIKEAEHELKIEVMRAYFNVLYMKSVVKIYTERVKLFEEMAQITKSKNPYINKDVDTLQANIKHKKQIVLLNKAKEELLSAQFELNNVLNLRSDEIMFDTQESSLFDNNLTILNINLPTYEKIEETAMQYSYSIKIADNTITKAQKELSLERRKRIPDIKIAGGYAYQTSHQTGGEALPGAFVGAGTELPLLYFYNPEVNQAKIKIIRNKLNRLSYESRLKIALKKSFNTFKYSKDNIEYYKSIIGESKQMQQTYTKKYQNGQVSLLNVMQVDNAHKELVNEYLNEIKCYYNAYLDLMENVGHDILLEEEMFETEL